MKIRHMKPEDLATRWDVNESTLGQWRWFGKGPSFLKLGALILYRMKDVEKFEDLAMQHLKNNSSEEIFAHIRLESKEGE